MWQPRDNWWVMVDGDKSVGWERFITEESGLNKSKTQEKEGGNKEAKVKDDAKDEDTKQSCWDIKLN